MLDGHAGQFLDLAEAASFGEYVVATPRRRPYGKILDLMTLHTRVPATLPA